MIFTNIADYKKATAPSEDVEQAHLIQWCRFMEDIYPELGLIFHIPNEGKRTASSGGKLKQIGLRSGVPDLCLPVKRAGYNALFIELKKIGGKPTQNQLKWISSLNKEGNYAIVCEGACEAEVLLEAYINEDTYKLKKLMEECKWT